MRVLLLFVTSTSMICAQDREAPLPYPVSHLQEDDDQIKRVHKSVLLNIAAAHEAKIKESSFDVKILQRVDGRGYLASVGDRTVLIETNDSKYADGDKLSTALEATGETFSYTSVLGAAKNVHVLRSLQLPDLPDLAKFIEQLKAGKTFLIIQGEREIRCADCGGFGKGGMLDGRYVPCRGCRDRGRWTKPNYYEIRW